VTLDKNIFNLLALMLLTFNNSKCVILCPSSVLLYLSCLVPFLQTQLTERDDNLKVCRYSFAWWLKNSDHQCRHYFDSKYKTLLNTVYFHHCSSVLL